MNIPTKKCFIATANKHFGSSATLAAIGRKTTGGAIRFITRNPTDELEGMVKVNVGNHNYREVNGVFNEPLGDNDEIRLAAQKADRNGCYDNLYQAPGVRSGLDDEDNLTLRATLSWVITDRINLLLSQNYFENDGTRGMHLVDRSPQGLSTDVAPVGPGIAPESWDEVALNITRPTQVKYWASQAVLTVGLNVLDTQYKDYIAGGRTFNGTPGSITYPFDADGHDMVRAPEYAYTLSSRYSFNLPGVTVPVALTYSYKGKLYYDFVTVSETDMTPWDESKEDGATIGYVPNSERWQFRIWRKNLTDEKTMPNH